MDLTKPVTYRGLNINGVNSTAGSRVLRGLAVEDVDYSDVPAVGYTEKRAAADGMHASDVYLGARKIEFTGHIYAGSAAEFYDYLHILRAVFSPTSAYTESPGDRGFLPLEYQQPTADNVSFPGGLINLQILARPLDGSPRFSINRDRLQNGNPNKPTATEWHARMFAKDPRVYVTPEQVVSLASGPTIIHSQAINRGDYETPMNFILVVTAAPPANSAIFFNGFGVGMHIVIPSVASRVYRWFGDDRVLMEQDSTAGASAPFVMRQDLVSWTTKNHKPMVAAHINPPSRPFSTYFGVQIVGATLATGSRVFWSEAFA